MKKRATEPLDFIIDKLTNSIENVVTGDSFPTVISLLSASDIKNVTKKRGWQFDWRHEWKQPIREVYKLTIPNNPTIIQGLVSLEIRSDHIYMHLVESAPFNKGKSKIMKREKSALDVDTIGGNTPLTNKEAKAISEYLKSKKVKKSKTNVVTSSTKKEKVTA